MSEDAKALIRQIQPRVTGDHTLWHIHELDIVDKHRLVIAAAIATAGWEVDIAGGVTLEFPALFSFRLRAGHEITNLPTSTFEGQKLTDFKLASELRFDEPTVIPFEPVLQTLHKMTNLIDDLLGRFEEFLG